jgi:hypothetical protein
MDLLDCGRSGVKMAWQISGREVNLTLEYELPAGKYYVGNPADLLLPGVCDATKTLPPGAYKSDAYVYSIHSCNQSDYVILVNGEIMAGVICSDVRLSIMSADIVQPLPENDDCSFVLDAPAKAVYDYNTESIIIRLEKSYIEICPYPDQDDETDEQMYTRMYAAIGVEY